MHILGEISQRETLMRCRMNYVTILRMQILKYIVAGGIAAVTNVGVLYILVTYAHLHYLSAEAIAFLLAFIVNFSLQKIWTFELRGLASMYRQMAGYLMLSLANMVCNLTILYLLVSKVGIWYPLAEALTIALLAGVSFYVCRTYIFGIEAQGRQDRTWAWLRANPSAIIAAAAFVFMLFLATDRLTENPPTWFDEGIIVQVAMNEAIHNPHAQIQIAPGTYVSAAQVGTTSYPLTYLIAAAFQMFGMSLLTARAVMLIFLILCVCMAFTIARREAGMCLAACSLWLFVTFPPLYADGKDVLGEVPGLLYTFLFLYFVSRIEKDRQRWIEYLGAGLFLGLAVATKPIFFLLLVPAGIVFLTLYRTLSVRTVGGAFLGFAVPFALWLWVQFGGQGIAEIFALYANPYGVDVWSAIVHNALLFVQRPEPLYALLLLLTWVVAIGVRAYRREPVSRTEWIAGGFAALVYLAFLRANGDYRYFFLGEVLALLYVPSAFVYLCPRFVPRSVPYVLVGVLIAFQIYQGQFHSWIAVHQDSHRTADIIIAMQTLNPLQSVFVYSAPELPLFLPQGMPYYQYLPATDNLILGADQVSLVAHGVPDYVLLPSGLARRIDLTQYKETTRFNRYSIWQKK